MRALLLVVAASLPAQTVTVTNNTPHTFRGWARAYLPTWAPADSGWHADAGMHYVACAGQEPGNGPVDIWAELGPWQTRSMDLQQAEPTVRPVPHLEDFDQAYGTLTVNGFPSVYQTPEIDGAGILLRGSVLVEPRVMVSWAAKWYPDQRGTIAVNTWAHLVGPGSDTYRTREPIHLQWSEGRVWVGTGLGRIYPRGTELRRSYPVLTHATVVWPPRWRPGEESTALAIHARGVTASGQ